MTYYTYWKVRSEQQTTEPQQTVPDTDSGVYVHEEHPVTSTLALLSDYAKNDLKPRFWCDHCCWSGAHADTAVTLAQHCRVCYSGESFRWIALAYSQSRHATEEGAEQAALEEDYTTLFKGYLRRRQYPNKKQGADWRHWKCGWSNLGRVRVTSVAGVAFSVRSSRTGSSKLYEANLPRSCM